MTTFNDANLIGTLAWDDVIGLLVVTSAMVREYENCENATVLIPVPDSAGNRPWIQMIGIPIFFQKYNPTVRVYVNGWMEFITGDGDVYHLQLVAPILNPIKALENL